MRNHKCAQEGIGLLELMLSLLVISVLMMAVLSYYRITNTSQKVSNAVHMMGGLMVASEDWLTTYHAFTQTGGASEEALSISIRNLVDKGKLPRDFCSNADCTENQVNPWGGEIRLFPKDASHISIVLTGLPFSEPGKGVCQQLSDLLGEKVSSDCSKSSEGEYVATYP